MLTETMTEIGGLMIITAVTLQIVLGLRWVLARTSRHQQPASPNLVPLESHSTHMVKPADQKHDAEPPSWLGKRKFQVAMRSFENLRRDICSFYLVPVDKRPIPPYRPGQFLTFELPGLDRGQPVVRCYSLSESPENQNYYRITVKKLPETSSAPPGLSSCYFHDHVQEGDVVEVLAPAGEFYLDQTSDRPVVLIAGGVGLTPLLSMLNWLAETKSEREIWFFYGVRNKAEHAMYDHLVRMRKENPRLHMFIAYSQPGDNCVRGTDYNVDGHVTIDLLQGVLEASNYEFYLCGPPTMMATMHHDLAVWGVPPEDIKYEAFGPALVDSRRTSEPEKTHNETNGFRVKFARSGQVVQWTGDADTLLELAEANGVKMPCSCRSGNCGTCLTALRQGTVEYIHPPSKEHDEGACLPCIARPRSDVVLDI